MSAMATAPVALILLCRSEMLRNEDILTECATFKYQIPNTETVRVTYLTRPTLEASTRNHLDEERPSLESEL